MNKPIRWTLAAVALLALGAVACGDRDTIVQGNGQQTGINVSGVGRVFGSPDIALLNLGVRVEAETVAEAREQAAEAQTAIIDSLTANGVEERDIQTQQFSVQPQYDFPDRVQTIRGYEVRNILNVKVRDLDSTSQVLDDATAAGGNAVQVNGINFTIDDPSALEAEARELAVQDARSRAEDLAGHSGAQVGALVSISEFTNFGLGGEFARSVSQDAGASTPIMSGELEVVVNVNVVYSID